MIAAFLGLPRWAHIALGIGALLLAALTLHKCAVSDAVKADRAETSAAATKTAREADQAAQTTVTAKQADIEQGNRNAEAAARDSSDPLRDGLNSLRSSK